MINLDTDFQRKLFLKRLVACEYAIAQAWVDFTERQVEFIKDMRWRFDHRTDNNLPGVDLTWNPTTNQMNYLGNMFQKTEARG